MCKNSRLALLVACLLAATQSLQAQNAPLPAAVNKPSLTYMPTLRGSILFGGYPQRGTPLNETWLLKDGCWQKLNIEAPSARAGHGAAYDVRRKKLVIFGGASGSGPLNDTWEFDGQRWSKVEAIGPPARTLTRMVYDTQRKRVLLVAGRDGRPTSLQVFADTWEWNGKTWKQISMGLPARFEHAVIYDSKRKFVTVFGGNNATDRNFGEHMMGDTWVLRNNKWSQVAGEAPGKRDHHAMAYHDARGIALLFGGAAGRDFFGDTWSFDGKTWNRLQDPNAPSARGGVPAMTYDSDRKKVVMYGGWGKEGPHQDVWDWDGKWEKVKSSCGPTS